MFKWEFNKGIPKFVYIYGDKCPENPFNVSKKHLIKPVRALTLFSLSLLLFLISLSLCSVTSQGEMKMPVCIEDECNPDLPPASLLFRSARQYAYGVLFSLAETQRRLERLAMRKRSPVDGKHRPWLDESVKWHTHFECCHNTKK